MSLLLKQTLSPGSRVAFCQAAVAKTPTPQGSVHPLLRRAAAAAPATLESVVDPFGVSNYLESTTVNSATRCHVSRNTQGKGCGFALWISSPFAFGNWSPAAKRESPRKSDLAESTEKEKESSILGLRVSQVECAGFSRWDHLLIVVLSSCETRGEITRPWVTVCAIDRLAERWISFGPAIDLARAALRSFG